MYPPVSIVIATYNRANRIKKCIDTLLCLDYPEYEIIIVDDGSSDNTENILMNYKNKYRNKIKVVTHEHNRGWAAGKNSGIRISKYDIIALIDDDIIVEKNWLTHLVSMLLKNIKNRVAAVTSVGIYAGHSICYLKNIMIRAGLFDERFVRNLRQDTDLAFRIFDIGYKIIYIPEVKFTHDHPNPKTNLQKFNFIKNRILVHQMDVLLFKKNPERTKKFLNVKFRFASPLDDFKRATGLWCKRGKFELGSPEGITIIHKTPLNIPIIFLGGILYAIFIKLTHLYASIKYDTFLI